MGLAESSKKEEEERSVDVRKKASPCVKVCFDEIASVAQGAMMAMTKSAESACRKSTPSSAARVLHVTEPATDSHVVTL